MRSMSTKSNTNRHPETSSRVLRECRSDNVLKQSKESTRVSSLHPLKKTNLNAQPRKNAMTTKPGLKRTTSGVPSESSKVESLVCKERCLNPLELDRKKPWFQVLQKSPSKTRPEKTLRTNRLDIPCRCKSSFDTEIEKENFARDKDSRRFNLLIDMLKDTILDKIANINDEEFLKSLNAIRDLLVHSIQRNSSELNLLTDDDKYKFQKPTGLDGNSKTSSDLLLKALLKETKEQKDMLQSVNVQISQLREENKMVSLLKDARMTLEAKLSSRNAEVKHLKQEHEKLRRLLERRDKENEDLRELVSVLKVAANHHEQADRSMRIIATPPSCSLSFDMPIRPASSSPTGDDDDKKNNSLSRTKNEVSRTIEFENLGNHSPGEKSRACQDAKDDAKLQELKEDVNKFLEVLESDMANLNVNDVSLNLSDVTYKWSV